MKTYKVTITETSKRDVEVEADSAEEAEDIVNDMWYRGEIILDADDFFEVDYSSAEAVKQNEKKSKSRDEGR